MTSPAPRRTRTATRQLSVNNDRCRRYGTCQSEAPKLFQLTVSGELRYRRNIPPDLIEQAKAAVRCCPMLAIALDEKR